MQGSCPGILSRKSKRRFNTVCACVCTCVVVEGGGDRQPIDQSATDDGSLMAGVRRWLLALTLKIPEQRLKRGNRLAFGEAGVQAVLLALVHLGFN